MVVQIATNHANTVLLPESRTTQIDEFTNIKPTRMSHSLPISPNKILYLEEFSTPQGRIYRREEDQGLDQTEEITSIQSN